MEPVTTQAFEHSKGWAIPLVAAAVFVVVLAASLFHWVWFDYTIVHFMNRPSHRWLLLDLGINDLNVEMFSNVVVLTLVWYAWFSTESVFRRTGLIVGVVLSLLAGFVSRGLQLALPTHPRPLHDPALGFRVPFTVLPDSLNHWSSFPSDHAAVFYGLAATVYFCNRRVGKVAVALVTVMNVARIYCGFHYPTDIIGGAMIGVLAAYMAYRLGAWESLQRLVPKDRARQALFYAVCFYVTFGVATLFNDYRNFVGSSVAALKHHQQDSPQNKTRTSN